MLMLEVCGCFVDAEDGGAVEVDGVVGPEIGDDHGVLLLAELVHRQHLRHLLAHLLRNVHLDSHLLLLPLEISS